MDPKNGKAGNRRGTPFTFFLAVVLLIVTVLTPFVSHSPKKRLERALEKSGEEWADEEVLHLLYRAFLDGSFLAEGERDTLSYTASLPKSASLAQKGSGGNSRVTLYGDTLYLQSGALGEETLSAPRGDASVALCDSAFSDGKMPDMQMRLFRTALALSDDVFSRSAALLQKNLKTAFLAGKPAFSAVGEEVQIGEKKRKATSFTYEMEKEGVEKALASWKRAGEREETREALSLLRSFLSATLSSAETSEASQRFVSFLCGQGSEFAEFEKRLLSENSRACLTVTVYKGRVVRGSVSLSGGDFVLEGNLDLSEKLRKDRTWSASLQAKTGEERHFSLSVGSCLEENSKSALIRRWNYAFADAVGAITTGAGEETGEIIFSWGKEKGDLGLRLAAGESTLVFRGELEKYKKNKKIVFKVGRVELDGIRISEEDSYSVTLSVKGDEPDRPKGTKALFPEGEEREKMARLLTERFARFHS